MHTCFTPDDTLRKGVQLLFRWLLWLLISSSFDGRVPCSSGSMGLFIAGHVGRGQVLTWSYGGGVWDSLCSRIWEQTGNQLYVLRQGLHFAILESALSKVTREPYKALRTLILPFVFNNKYHCCTSPFSPFAPCSRSRSLCYIVRHLSQAESLRFCLWQMKNICPPQITFKHKYTREASITIPLICSCLLFWQISLAEWGYK